MKCIITIPLKIFLHDLLHKTKRFNCKQVIYNQPRKNQTKRSFSINKHKI